jgi:RNA polymerase sigma factor (sigma-70 family)
MSDSSHDLTKALVHWSELGPSGFNEALRYLYPEIRKVAQQMVRNSDLTLSPETLAQEVAMKLASLPHSSWPNRRPFFKFLYKKMRQFLSSYREKMSAKKRLPKPGDLAEFDPLNPTPDFSERELRHFLSELFRDDPVACAVVTLRYEGFTNDEVADRLGVAASTIDRRVDLVRRRLMVALRRKEDHRGRL